MYELQPNGNITLPKSVRSACACIKDKIQHFIDATNNVDRKHTEYEASRLSNVSFHLSLGLKDLEMDNSDLDQESSFWKEEIVCLTTEAVGLSNVLPLKLNSETVQKQKRGRDMPKIL